MNKKKIVILSVVIVALIGILVWVMMLDSTDPKPDVGSDLQVQTAEKNYEETGEIYRCSIDSIENITVNLPSESFTFVKADGVWGCDALPSGVLNSSKVGAVATGLGSVKYVEVFDEGVRAEDCGITDATPYVTFVSDIGEVVLRAEDSFNDENLCYVTVSVSERVYSVKKSSIERFFEPLESYRNDSLLKVNADNVVGIELSNSSGVARFRKGEADRANAVFDEWRMIEPVEMTASDSSITENIFDAVNNMKIADYVDDSGNFAAYGLEVGDKYLTFEENDGDIRTLYFGDKKDGAYYVRMDNSDSVYAVDESGLPFVHIKPVELADRHIKLVMKDALAAIDVVAGEDSYEIKVSQTRNESTLNGKKLDETQFSSGVFSAVCGMVADDIYTGDAGTAEVTIVYTYTDGTSDRIEFSSYDDRYYVSSENGSARFLIQKSKVDAMLASLAQ